MKKRTSRAIRLAAIGPHFVATTLLGLVLGRYVMDPWLGTAPFFTVALIILGFVASFIHLLRELEALDKQNDQDPPKR